MNLLGSPALTLITGVTRCRDYERVGCSRMETQ